jgi:ankyrin repeat protein
MPAACRPQRLANDAGANIARMPTPHADDADLLEFLQVIARGDIAGVSRMLVTSGDRIALQAIRRGSSRQDSTTYFLEAVRHHVYAGDTGLHIAAAAYRRDAAHLLISHGASVQARNRRGAEPLHYAADGMPSGPRWAPDAQREVIAYLVANGADPDARDRSGVAPVHRAVRTRCAAAVQALLESGADPNLPNRSGSTPLHLAVQNTGRGGSGAAVAREQQTQIIELLLRGGARTTDVTASGKTVEAAVTSAWVRDLLA